MSFSTLGAFYSSCGAGWRLALPAFCVSFVGGVSCCATVSMKTKKKRTHRSAPPQARRCKVHGKPILPGRWRGGHRTTGCADCYRTRKVPPPKKRLCQEHGLPILSARWWSGYRRKGCKECFEVPEPEDRLCRKHDIPIQPSMWIRGRHSTGCWKCLSSRPGFAVAKARHRALERLRLLKAKRKRRWRRFKD
jgi:hypothetical protein